MAKKPTTQDGFESKHKTVYIVMGGLPETIIAVFSTKRRANSFLEKDVPKRGTMPRRVCAWAVDAAKPIGPPMFLR